MPGRERRREPESEHHRHIERRGREERAEETGRLQHVLARPPSGQQPLRERAVVGEGARTEHHGQADQVEHAEHKLWTQLMAKAIEKQAQLERRLAAGGARQGHEADRKRRHEDGGGGRTDDRQQRHHAHQQPIAEHGCEPAERRGTKQPPALAEPAHAAGGAYDARLHSRIRRKCSGSCACTSMPARGRWKSCRRESQKRSAAARSITGHAARSPGVSGRTAS